MANKSLFSSLVGSLPPANAHNRAGGTSYVLTPKHALAQYALTGCLNGTFYASAETQLDEILALCNAQGHDFIPTEFIAQTALYAREHALMKDVPALLTAALAGRPETEYLKAVFPRVIDTGKMLRTFVQIVRSGATGRKSLGTMPKRLVADWFADRSDEQIFASAIGNNPSLADVIKMIHPKPHTASRRALYGYLIGKAHNADDLPEIVKEYEAFKRGDTDALPNVPFQMLTHLPLSRQEWSSIAMRTSWQTLLMNLNTFARHGVFENRTTTAQILARLTDEREIRHSRVFPYRLLAAFMNLNDETTEYAESQGITSATHEAMRLVALALQDATEVATENVPTVEGQLYICVDVSGSMQSSVSGSRKGATSKVRCIDAAALIASALMRKNPNAEIVPFEQHVVKVRTNPRDSVMTNAQKLASANGGGTNCSAALRHLNDKNAQGDLVVFVSDNESWMDASSYRTTALMQEWQRFKFRNPDARLVCLDIQPGKTTQAAERPDILNIGGFSDDIFRIIADFAQGTLGPEHLTGEIRNVIIQKESGMTAETTMAA